MGITLLPANGLPPQGAWSAETGLIPSASGLCTHLSTIFVQPLSISAEGGAYTDSGICISCRMRCWSGESSVTSYQVLVALACRYSVMSSNAFKSRSAVGWSVARLGLPAYKPLSVSPEVASPRCTTNSVRVNARKAIPSNSNKPRIRWSSFKNNGVIASTPPFNRWKPCSGCHSCR